MKKMIKYTLLSVLLTLSSKAGDCSNVAKIVNDSILNNPKNVISIVSNQIELNKECVNSIVRNAIITSKADKELVAKIVDGAIKASPNKRALIITTALTVTPDASLEVLAVNSKYEPKKPTSYSSKGQYSPKGGAPSYIFIYSDPVNPLDFIGLNNVGNFTLLNIIPPLGQISVPDPYSR